MIKIASNEFYKLSYDEINNWIYWTMIGFWENMDIVPNFNSDWEKAISYTKKPFKIFADLSLLKPMPDDVKNANDKMQQYLMQNGCIKVCCLIDNLITKISLNKTVEASGMDKMVKYFSSSESYEAEMWLAS